MNIETKLEYLLHDNLIHGIMFSSDVGDFSSDVSFDIDHILEWGITSSHESGLQFLVSKAILTFHDVSDLVLELSWGDTQYSQFSGFSSGVYILEVVKERVDSPLASEDGEYYKWQINTNNKKSAIRFGASSMSLKLVGTPKQVNRQYLISEERY